MNKKIAKIVCAMIAVTLLVMPLAVYANGGIPQPHGISGTVYMSDDVTEAPTGTNFSVNNTNPLVTIGGYIEGITGVPYNTGGYDVAINGTDDDPIIIRAWNATHYGETTVTLAGEMTGVNVTIDTPTSNGNGAGAPNITSYAPETPVDNCECATRIFNITVNQTVNVSWQINGTEVQFNESVTEANYTNTSAVIGTWNVSAIVENANGKDMQTWDWIVTPDEEPVIHEIYFLSDYDMLGMIDGDETELVVNATDIGSCGIANVTVNFSAVGGPEEEVEMDCEDSECYLEIYVELDCCDIKPEEVYWEVDGEGDDNWNADVVYGEIELPVTVTDSCGNIATGEITLTLADTVIEVYEGWSLLSIPKPIDEIFSTVEDFDAAFSHNKSGWLFDEDEFVAELVNPASALYLKAKTDSTIGFVWSGKELVFCYKELKKGWNLIGVSMNDDAMVHLSSLRYVETDGRGVTTLYGPGMYNDNKDYGDSNNIYVDTTTWDFEETLYRRDGYWIYMRGEERTFSTPLSIENIECGGP